MAHQGQTWLLEMSSVFNELRSKQHFIDAIIVVDGVEFPVHKVIISTCVPFFRSLFTNWSSPDQKVFRTSIISADVMRVILEFAYTFTLRLTEDNVKDIMEAADKINSVHILSKCTEFILENISPRNCICFMHLASMIPNNTLLLTVVQYIIKNFSDVVPHGEFLELSMEELRDLVAVDDLFVIHESFVYESILRWIGHDPDRERHIAALLSKVRLALLDSDCMNKVLSNQLVTSNPECSNILSRVSRLRTHMSNNRPPLTGLQNYLALPRLPTAILLAIGGKSDRDTVNVIEAYDIRADRWISLENNQRSRAHHGTAFINGFVYIIGGCGSNRLEHFNNVQRFDPSRNLWEDVAPMHYRRRYVSVTVLNGYIYALGGFDGNTHMDTAERYDPETNQWSIIASMHHPRSEASCTTFQGMVYVCGGFNGQTCLQSAEYYDPQSDQWTIITPMNSLRCAAGVIAYAGRIYAVGGFDGINYLRTAEAYNPRTNTWTDVSPMNTQRSNFGIEFVEGRLFAVGGYIARGTTTFKVECYNTTTNEWTDACNMHIRRSSLSCCVIYGLPNLNNYAFPRNTLQSVAE